MPSYRSVKDAEMCFEAAEHYIPGTDVEALGTDARNCLVDHLPLAASHGTSTPVNTFACYDYEGSFQRRVANADGVTVLDTVQALTLSTIFSMGIAQALTSFSGPFLYNQGSAVLSAKYVFERWGGAGRFGRKLVARPGIVRVGRSSIAGGHCQGRRLDSQ